MVKLGDYNKMTITRFAESGAYLDGGDGIEILMPRRYTTTQMHPGDQVEAFVYLDQSNRPVATTETPFAKVGEFAYLQVSWLNEYGAFMNWGLLKDLFVPFSQQRTPMHKGEYHLIYIYIDNATGRIVGTTRLSRHITTQTHALTEQQEVEILPYKQTDMGYKAIILGPNCEGLLYNNELFSPVEIGRRMRAFIKRKRPDGKIDLILQESGPSHIADFSVELLKSLRERTNHFIALNDKSEPEEIYQQFGVSKKTFKRAVGALYKERLIQITDSGIRLI